MTRSHATAPSGFTLIEVLIALALTVVLLSAVYGALDLYFAYSTAGRNEIAATQLRRALCRRIARDLESVVMQLPETETAQGQAADDGTSVLSSSAESTNGQAFSAPSSSSSSAFGGSTTSSSLPQGSGEAFSAGASGTSGMMLNFDGLAETGAPTIFGLQGTSDLLHLSVALPQRDLNYAGLQSDVIGRNGELVLVTYGLAPVDPASLTTLPEEQAARHPGSGLGRRERDMYALDAVSEVLGESDILAPEVVEIQFRYFDGISWIDTWDSQSIGFLPRAIEMTMGFWTAPDLKNARGAARLDDGTVTYVPMRFALPMSSPAVTESAL